jgi:heme-degrading monooxygenase HmoA
MVARIWKGSVRRTDADDYAEYMREVAVAGYAATPGNEGVWMLRRIVDDRAEFVMFTLWESYDAIRRFAGDDYEQAVFYPEDERFLVERELRAAHYEVETQRAPWEPSAGQVGRVDEFLDAYRAAFEAFDADGIADLFSYPCQVTGSARAEPTTAASRQAWLPQLERLVSAYREIGVHSAHIGAVRTIALAPDILQTVVRWEVADAGGGTIYSFDAAYTLTDDGEALRVGAIAENETPQLRAVLAARRGA